MGLTQYNANIAAFQYFSEGQATSNSLDRYRKTIIGRQNILRSKFSMVNIPKSSGNIGNSVSWLYDKPFTDKSIAYNISLIMIKENYKVKIKVII